MKGKKFLAFSLAAALLVGGAMSVSAAGVQDIFDANAYAGKYADLKATYGTDASALLGHFLAAGAKEGRIASDILDVAAYRKAYADLDAAYGDNWDAYVEHYLTYGIKEKRTTGVLFDLADYAAKNPDVKAAYGEDYAAIAQHYVNFGKAEGRKGGEIKKEEPAPVVVAASGSGSSNNNTAPTPDKPQEPTVEEQVTHVHQWQDEKDARVIAAGSCTQDRLIEVRCTLYKMKNVLDKDGNIIGTTYDTDRWGNKIQCDERKVINKGTAHVYEAAPDNNANYYIKPATCFSTGIEKYTCARCGEQVQKLLPKLEHVFQKTGPDGQEEVVKPRGCSEALRGYTVYKCYGGCGLTEQRDFTYLDHQVATYNINVTPATCSSIGTAYGYCSVCGALDKQVTPVTAHNYLKDGADHNVVRYVDSYVAPKAAPCHQTVVLTTCVDCGRINAVNASADQACVDTAENEGKGNGYCDVCQREMKRNHTNQVMQYDVGDILNDSVGQ